MSDRYPLHLGSSGPRVRDAQWLLTGHNVFHETFLHGGRSAIDGSVGPATAKAFHDAKWLLGYPASEVDRTYGLPLRALLLGERKLTDAMRRRRRSRLASRTNATRFYPLGVKGPLIGLPGQGTHSFSEPPNNWESDNAVDISIPVGTPVYAISAGVIGESFGPLDSSNPRFAGLRLHLEVALPEREWYYAHLSAFAPGLSPGDHVTAGQRLGKSGSANGAPHLHLGAQNGSPLIVQHLPLAHG